MAKRWLLLLSVILLVQIHGCEGCYVEERMGLLEFKAFVKSNGYDADFLFPSWVEDSQSDCCFWDRVRCSNDTHHVIHLSLGSVMQWRPEGITLNISILQRFKELRVLDLSHNNINRWIENDESSRDTSGLKQLEALDLFRNSLPYSFLRSLSGLTSLKNLNLSHNGMQGPFPLPGTRLEILDLGANGLVGNIPSRIGELASLKALALQINGLNGSLAGLCELKRLEELDLSGNDFEGIIPPCLYNLTSLRYMSLGYNERIEGSFSFNSFANQSQLEAVMLTCGGDKLKVDVEFLNQSPLFQLKVLQLSNCSLNDSSFLRHQQGLRFVDLSFNKLNGTFPSWLLENNAELRVVDLTYNSFTGQLNLPTTPMKNMIRLYLSNNQLYGQLPDDFGNILSTLEELSLSHNHFGGDLPSSVSAMRELFRLDLSWNNFSGEVPKELFTSCTKLLDLLLSHNQFSGDIFSIPFNSSSELSWLELEDNRFTGEIPSWLHTLEYLSTLVLQNNSFKGQFPCGRLLHLGYLDLSHNSISGPLPSCLDPQYLLFLILEGNKFTGSIPNAFFNSFNLSVLHLGDNHLSGSVPDLVFDTPPNLQYLFLGKNHLSGLIPRQLCQLKNISIMDLSSNSFSGPIPSCFYDITFGKLDESQRFLFYGTASDELQDAGYKRLLNNYFYHVVAPHPYVIGNVEIFLGTKNMVRLYKGRPLLSMSGLDLSCNNLTSKIPFQLGNLSSLVMLNLSHNQFIGPIPTSFSNLAAIESLDLSFNSLGGGIPLELNNLNFLSTFNVTHNNLSGTIPFTGQFSTFDESSYGENLLLCGSPSKKICPKDHVIDSVPPPDEAEGKWFEIDSAVFLASFGATYLVFLLASMTLLYINPLWRRRWFYFIEDCFWSSRFFVSDAIRKLSTKCNG